MQTGNNRAAMLNGIVQRIENITQEIKELSNDRKEIYAEAKAGGFDVAMIREMLKLKSMDKDQREERETLRDSYMNVLDLI